MYRLNKQSEIITQNFMLMRSNLRGIPRRNVDALRVITSAVIAIQHVVTAVLMCRLATAIVITVKSMVIFQTIVKISSAVFACQ